MHIRAEGFECLFSLDEGPQVEHVKQRLGGRSDADFEVVVCECSITGEWVASDAAVREPPEGVS